MTYENEQWLPVRGFEGAYEVSNAGRLRSVTRTVVQHRPGQRPRAQLRNGKVLSRRPNGDGYRRFVLRVDGEAKSVNLHTVVAEAFLGPRPAGMMVLHNDGNPLNNQATNLRYGTAKDNQDDARKHGCMAVGTKNPQAKLTEAIAREILTNPAGRSTAELARIYGVSQTAIYHVQTGKRWRHVEGPRK